MSLLTKLRHTPKRFGILAALVVATTGAALTFAWGPDRPTFTVENPAPYVTFNSITNNPVDGDERNFVRIKDASTNNWTDDIVVQPGKEYKVRMVVHNNAGENLNLKAINTTVKAAVPDTTGKAATITGFVSADNAQPKQVWDEVKLTSDKNFNLVYVAGSAKIWNQGYATSGATLPDSIVTTTGAKVGYAKAGDGIIPGCFQYLSYVEFTVKPQVQQTADFTLVKDVRKTGTTTYGQTAAVAPGDTVDYRLSFKNTGEATLNNVMIKDALPTGLTYVSGSAKLQNANYPYPNTLALSSSLFAGGVNIGHYSAGTNAYVTFQAKVNGNDQLPTCGLNTLKNVATVETDAGSVKDDADVTVTKTCTPPKEIQVCRLSDKTIVTIKESDFDASKYSKNLDDCKTVPPKDIQVCRLSDKTIVTIKETDFDASKYSKNLDDCKETPKTIEVCELATKKIVTIDEKDFDANKYSKDLSKCEETPVKDIKVCRLSDKTIVTIKETEFDTDKYSKNLDDCKETPKPETMEVCELATKQLVTIDKTAYDESKYSTDFSKCKDVVTPPTPETPQVIASTGPETLLGGLIGSSALGLSISSYIRSRRALRG